MTALFRMFEEVARRLGYRPAFQPVAVMRLPRGMIR